MKFDIENRLSIIATGQTGTPLWRIIADKLLKTHGARLDLIDGQFDSGIQKNRSLDSTLKFSGTLEDGQEVFAIVASPLNPDHIETAVNNIGLAHRKLSDKTAKAFLKPLFSGYVDVLSYAIWPKHPPLLTGGKLNRRVRKALMQIPLLDWTLHLCEETASKGEDLHRTYANFSKALNFVCTDEALPEQMRQSAKLALGRMDRGLWRPKHCFEHGDLWVGNVLSDRSVPGGLGFHIIDCIGNKPNGYPVYDFVRLVNSMRTPGFMAKAYAKKFSTALRCDPCDLHGYALASLGDIGQNLDFFDPKMYQNMAIKVDQTIVGLTHGGLRPEARAGMYSANFPRARSSRTTPPRTVPATVAKI